METNFLMVLTAEIFTGTDTSGDSRTETAALRYCVTSVRGKKELNWLAKTNARPCKKGASTSIL